MENIKAGKERSLARGRKMKGKLSTFQFPTFRELYRGGSAARASTQLGGLLLALGLSLKLYIARTVFIMPGLV